MSVQNQFTDLVFSLSDKDFELLQDAVAARRNKERYNVTGFEELAIKNMHTPSCPVCGSDEYVSNGHTPDGKQRYLCGNCHKP